MHNLGLKSTDTRPVALRRAVVGGCKVLSAREPRPILSRAIPVGRDPLARRNSSVPHHGRKEASSLVSLFQFGREQAKQGRHARSLLFIPLLPGSLRRVSYIMPALDCHTAKVPDL